MKKQVRVARVRRVGVKRPTVKPGFRFKSVPRTLAGGKKAIVVAANKMARTFGGSRVSMYFAVADLLELVADYQKAADMLKSFAGPGVDEYVDLLIGEFTKSRKRKASTRRRAAK